MDHVQTPAITNAAGKIRDGAVEMKTAVIDKGKDVFQDYCDQSEDHIKTYPIRSVLIALGVGVAVGALLFRRS